MMTTAKLEIEASGAQVALIRRPKIAGNIILAHARDQADDLSYAGDVTPHQAWILFSAGIAELVDVRTARELQRVGSVPDARHVEWLSNADMRINQNFISELRGNVCQGDVVLILCRSGKRSVAAAQAATEAGFRNVFNILEGFEGDGNPQRGWLNRGLPSIMSTREL